MLKPGTQGLLQAGRGNKRKITIMRPILLTGTVLCLLASSCQSYREKAAKADTVSASALELADLPANAPEEEKSEAAKFIRSADIRYKVKDVAAATYHIEAIVSKNRGYVSYTHLSSGIDHTEQIQISKDSSLETTHYTMSNRITLRVPNTLLDTTLREIMADVVFLDHRTIKADDVTIQYLENSLGQKRYAGNAKIQPGAKQRDINETGELSLYRKEKQDEYFIANKYIDRDVRLSEVSIEIYQRPSIRREMVANPDNIESYHPGFFSRMSDALVTGWELMEDLVLFLLKFWILVPVAVGTVFLLRRMKGRTKPVVHP